MGEKKRVGVVTRYFGKISVAAIMLEDSLEVGARISIEGTTTNFEQNVASMQIDREDIQKGEPGQEIAIKVADRVRENDVVYLV
ncbi:MAG: translation elongation factor-like protein [Candidatus Thorarchaeota archaeon]|nr:MAG: translation elongation factor-like protein [Candidatus Thorarchaeota archaeon]